MPTSFNLRSGLHQIYVASTPGTGQALGGNVTIAPDLSSLWQEALCIRSNSIRSSVTGGWSQLPAGLANTNSSAAAGCWHPHGPTGTASAGTSTAITTNFTAWRRLDGVTIRLTGGTGAGQERVIRYNTIGANSVVTVTEPWSTQPDATTTWLLLSGRYYVISVGTNPRVFDFKYYDPATGAWSALLASVGAGYLYGGSGSVLTAVDYSTYITEQAVTSATGTTLTTSGKNWSVNQWKNQQVRITSGLGAGQVRVILSNTASQLTVSAWTTTPDNTSVYTIEGVDDYLYFISSGTTEFIRYSRSADTWTSITARPSSTSSSSPTLVHMTRVDDAAWSDETNYLNGRYLYLFRCNGTGLVDRYDISADSWSAITTTPVVSTSLSLGSSAILIDGEIYLQAAPGSNSFSWYRFDPVTNYIEALAFVVTSVTAAGAGMRIFATRLMDSRGATRTTLFQQNVVGSAAENDYYFEVPVLCPTSCRSPQSHTSHRTLSLYANSQVPTRRVMAL